MGGFEEEAGVMRNAMTTRAPGSAKNTYCNKNGGKTSIPASAMALAICPLMYKRLPPLDDSLVRQLSTIWEP